VAAELRRQLPRAVVFNPEYIGYLLQRIPGGRKVDYQDSSAWRSLTIASAKVLGLFGATVIIPMAFSDRHYLEQIRSGLAASGSVRHYCLVASLSTVQERLHGRGESLSDPRWSWVHRRAAECCAAHLSDDFAERIDAEGRSPGDIARDIVSRIRDRR
jgi:hypothetical protein